jgi:hypothetical protein
MLKRLHPIAGMIAFLTILTFWLSTAISELFGSAETIATVKLAIPWGFLICASTGNHRRIWAPDSWYLK